jgi:hypothetical protein
MNAEGGNMRLAKSVIAGAAAVAVVPLGALPAYASGPSLPPGCTYNSSTHQTTCSVATTSTTYTGVGAGDMSSYPDFPSYTTVPASSIIVGGVTGTQICAWSFGDSNWRLFAARNLGVTVTTTTTTVSRGPSPHGHLVGQPVTQNTVTGVTNILGGTNLFCIT